MKKYFIFDNGEKRGPYVLAQIQSMWNSGAITADALYWTEGVPENRPILELIASGDHQPSEQNISEERTPPRSQGGISAPFPKTTPPPLPKNTPTPSPQNTPHPSEESLSELKFECANCGQRMSASIKQAGVIGACPNCGKEITVPEIAEPRTPPVTATFLPPRPPSSAAESIPEAAFEIVSPARSQSSSGDQIPATPAAQTFPLKGPSPGTINPVDIVCLSLLGIFALWALGVRLFSDEDNAAHLAATIMLNGGWITTVWVALDSHRNRIAGSKSITRSKKPYNWNNGWAAWGITCFFFGPLLFPIYLFERHKTFRERKITNAGANSIIWVGTIWAVIWIACFLYYFVD